MFQAVTAPPTARCPPFQIDPRPRALVDVRATAFTRHARLRAPSSANEQRRLRPFFVCCSNESPISETRVQKFAAALAHCWANRSAWLAAGVAAAGLALQPVPAALAWPGMNEALQQQADRNQMLEEQEIFNEAWAVVNQTYVDPEFNGNDWRAVFREVLDGRSPASREETYGSIRKMLERLGDPYTRFLDPQQYAAFEISTTGDLMGVGLQFALSEERGEPEVIVPLEGSPAEKAGMLPGDVIVAIDGEATKAMSVDEVATRIRGPQGSKVTLTVDRPGAPAGPLTFALTRDKVTVTPVYAQLFEVPEDEAEALAGRGRAEPPPAAGPSDRIGYIYLREFSMNAAREVARAVDRLEGEGAQGYVLDLRNNPGGVLDAGLDIARLWLEPGSPVVYTIDREKEEVTYTSGSSGVDATGRLRAEKAGRLQHEVVRKPLVVLVNKGSASASEIVASALQENCRAVLVGSPTYGKGLVQAVFRLFDGSAMTVTVARYETAARHDIHKVGVAPDMPFPDPPAPAPGAAPEVDDAVASRFRRLLDGKKVGRLEEQAADPEGEDPGLDARTAIALVNPLKLAPRLDECERPDGGRGPARPLEIPERAPPAAAPIASAVFP